jgi:cytochrome c
MAAALSGAAGRRATGAVLAAVLLALAADAAADAAAGAAAGTLAGDLAAGAEVFRSQCIACHAERPGVHGVGPSLAGVYGRPAGASSFAHYEGLVGADFVWDEARLDAYLADPKAFVLAHTANQTTAMTFALADAAARRAVISHLRTLPP